MIETATLDGTFGGTPGGGVDARYLVLALEGLRPHEPAQRYPLSHVTKSVQVGRGPARDTQFDSADGCLRIDVPDRRISGCHVRLERQRGRWVAVDQESKNGTRVNGARVERVELQDGDVLEVGSTYFVYREVAMPPTHSRTPPPRMADDPAAFATLHAPLEHQFEVLRRVARADVPVMVSGETGTGKELVARAVHDLSGRSGAFVAANCGAIAPTLVESELFGHKKGAFSGASQDKPGLVVASDGGTLFLDELGELPEQAQVALLRVLQEREVRPVGAAHPVKVDLRVVTATHRDLATLVEQGTFRADLYARLAGFAITVPPLRDRMEDLGLLTSVLLRRIAGDRAEKLRIHSSAARVLFGHHWPLNVRELEQALRVTVAVAEEDELSAAHLPQTLRSAPSTDESSTGSDTDPEQRLVALMKKHKGNLSAIARDMSTSRSQVRRLAQRYGLDPESFR